MATLAPMLVCMMAGCTSTGGFTAPWNKTAAKPDAPKDNLILTGGRGLEREPVDAGLRQELDTAKRLMLDKKYAEAEKTYHKLMLPGLPNAWFDVMNPFQPTMDAEAKKKYPRSVFEEALFGEGECQRLQKNYRDSMETYTKLLMEFQNSQYQRRVCEGLFEIADYWLEPTRQQMDQYQDQLAGKRHFVTPALYVHFNKEMPLLDAEGHATAILNTVRLHAINEPMAEKALLYLGTISFFRKEYKEADFYFTQIYTQFPNGDNAARSVKQSVICKQLMTGGTVYDLRPVEESKKLLMTAQGAYPELAKDEKWVGDQLKSMNLQQADRDFKIAEFYQRTGHPGSAYFYFELVCRRYPGTDFASKALQRKNELRGKAEREQSSQNAPPTPSGSPTPLIQGAPVLPGSQPPSTLPPGLDPRPVR